MASGKKPTNHKEYGQNLNWPVQAADTPAPSFNKGKPNLLKLPGREHNSTPSGHIRQMGALEKENLKINKHFPMGTQNGNGILRQVKICPFELSNRSYDSPHLLL